MIAGFYSCCNLGNPTWPYAAKFDLQGNMLWEKKFGDNLPVTGFYSIRELFDGSLIAAGVYNPPSSHAMGLIFKLTSNGDSIWNKTYYNGFFSHNYLQDIFPTPDGGFVACGYITPVLPDTGHQDLWILKIDSLGCEVSNCILSIDNIIQKKIIKVYPNAFYNFLNIEFDEPMKDCILEMYDISGRKIRNISIPATDQYVLETGLIPPGIYLLNLYDKLEKIYTGRFVKN